jgi:hypothetical protein
MTQSANALPVPPELEQDYRPKVTKWVEDIIAGKLPSSTVAPLVALSTEEILDRR